MQLSQEAVEFATILSERLDNLEYGVETARKVRLTLEFIFTEMSLILARIERIEQRLGMLPGDNGTATNEKQDDD